jgi:hypothetical protein
MTDHAQHSKKTLKDKIKAIFFGKRKRAEDGAAAEALAQEDNPTPKRMKYTPRYAGRDALMTMQPSHLSGPAMQRCQSNGTLHSNYSYVASEHPNSRASMERRGRARSFGGVVPSGNWQPSEGVEYGYVFGSEAGPSSGRRRPSNGADGEWVWMPRSIPRSKSFNFHMDTDVPDVPAIPDGYRQMTLEQTLARKASTQTMKTVGTAKTVKPKKSVRFGESNGYGFRSSRDFNMDELSKYMASVSLGHKGKESVMAPAPSAAPGPAPSPSPTPSTSQHSDERAISKQKSCNFSRPGTRSPYSQRVVQTPSPVLGRDMESPNICESPSPSVIPMPTASPELYGPPLSPPPTRPLPYVPTSPSPPAVQPSTPSKTRESSPSTVRAPSEKTIRPPSPSSAYSVDERERNDSASTYAKDELEESKTNSEASPMDTSLASSEAPSIDNASQESSVTSDGTHGLWSQHKNMETADATKSAESKTLQSRRGQRAPSEGRGSPGYGSVGWI